MFPTFYDLLTGTLGEDDVAETIDDIVSNITPTAFQRWYRAQEFKENIQKGQSYFNRPQSPTNPRRHNPSRLLQCHRKTYYTQLNAPAEKPDPNGIFWIGSQFEEELALPFLRDLVNGHTAYVTNSIWVDFTVQSDDSELRIKGETDPVIVDARADPLVLTEIKTKRKVGNLESPNRHHRAQVHAYMKGLSEKFERNITQAVIIYGGRTNLQVQTFPVKFDPVFWRRTVLEWAARHTEYRLRDELPPADPESDWECNVCEYRERCGNGDSKYSDIGPKGFLPGLASYPRSNVVEYLEAHDDAKLTPTLANQYPELAEDHSVSKWHCRRCDGNFAWDAIEWQSGERERPDCPDCPASVKDRQLYATNPNSQFEGEKP
jgi:CRISPR-associated exonuclease Cas4